jgi:hypothetical protein
MRVLLIVPLLLATMPCMAQYKCVLNGTASYQERPCGPNAKPLALPADTPVTDAERAEAAASLARQRAVAGQIATRHAIEDIDINRRSTLVRAEQAQKKLRCSDLLRESKNAQNEANTYRYHQGLIDDAHRRKREAEAAHFSECYAR